MDVASLMADDEDLDMIVAICSFMRRDLTRITRFFEETVPLYVPSEFKSHFRMSRTTMEILCQEMINTGKIPTESIRGRPVIPPEKQIIVFVWGLANKACARIIADRFDITMSSVSRVLHRGSEALLDLVPTYIKWPNGR
jgi:hypothetical protein